jgi:chromatin remodeling complex protein RSC6
MVWKYIKEKNLQNIKNRNEIIADEKLLMIFGMNRLSKFTLNRLISSQLTALPRIIK